MGMWTDDEKKELIRMWGNRIEEIKAKGNCSNGNVHRPAPLFSIGGKVGYTKGEMIKYCEDRINHIENT